MFFLFCFVLLDLYDYISNISSEIKFGLLEYKKHQNKKKINGYMIDLDKHTRVFYKKKCCLCLLKTEQHNIDILVPGKEYVI